MFTAEERGKALALYTAGPLLGPALGPIGKTVVYFSRLFFS